MSDKEIDFREELEYDYNKYISEIKNNKKRINNYIEELLNLKPKISVSPFAISSSSWYANEDREQSLYNDANDSTEERRRELSYKQGILEKWIDEGLFKERIRFSNGDNFYFTKVGGIEEGKFGDSYIYSYWTNNSIKKIRTLDIGNDSKSLQLNFGELFLKAEYQPIKNDLIDISYKTKNNNKRYKSARDEINQIKEAIEEKINIENFFKLRFEFSALGIQAKALYDIKNSIIDGSAGTGKSTIALQKLKMAKENQKISEDKMAVIVKNKQSIDFFYTLLYDKTLSLESIKIILLQKLLEDLKIINLKLEDINKAKAITIKIKKEIKEFIKDKNPENLKKHYSSISNKIEKNKILSYLKKLADKKIINFRETNIKNVENISLSLLKSIIKNDVASNNLKEIKSLVILKEHINYFNRQNRNEKKLKQLDKNSQKYENIKNKLLIPFKISLSDRQLLEGVLSKIYFEEDFIKVTFLSIFSEEESTLILLYLLDNRPKLYSLLLVDEAQDYTLVELELLRLLTDKIILTGDIWQNISNSGIKEWKNIIDFEKVYEDNIFTLKHNFRQTYQLANASYNYRQLLLGGELEDIGSDYYDDEKELNGKPYELVKIIFNQDMRQYIKNKIEHVKNRFTSQIPIVLIYKAKEEKEKYQKELSSFRLSYDTEEVKDIDVILVDILEAKGKQFPVVVSNLDGLTHREIYLIMTRGEFEVEFLSSQKDIENKYLEILYSNEWIETKEVDFVKNKLNIKKDLNSNIFCEKCDKPFNKLNSLDQHMASKKHKDDWEEYFSKDEVKERLKGKKLIHNHKKGQLVKEKSNEDKKSKINYDLDEKEDELEALNLANEKDESENFDEKKEKSKLNQEEESSAKSIQADLLEAKEKHQGEVKEIEILLDLNVVSDIDTYIKKVQEEYERNIKNTPTRVTTHIVNKKVKIGRKETKWFLEQQYKGLCQICGFTFTKRRTDKQYFELFDWFSEKITQQKVNVVQAGSSLCLCARCHSGVKYGSFTANLVDILKSLDVKKMNFDKFVSKISVTVENKEIPECYNFIENDMYKVDIRLFNQEEFIFYTEEHFLHLYTMLGLKVKE